MASKPFLPDTLDSFITYTQSLNSKDRAIGNTMYGIKHDKTPMLLPQNQDEYGYVFITRPQLNLTDSNIINNRIFKDLSTKSDATVQSFVRNTLDPRLYYSNESICPFVDPNNVFISVLTNSITKLSGWPDRTAPSWESKEGVRKEKYAMVDGISEINGVYDLDLTFRVFAGEPISMLMEKWMLYPGLIFEGTFNPYMDFIVENERDYDTRIYRLVMTSDGKYVKKIAGTGASFPVNDNAGRSFDYTTDVPYSDQNKEVTYRFKSIGAIYNDSILVFAFNRAVGIFHKGMRTLNEGNNTTMTKLTPNLLGISRNMGYPRINPSTYELEWWVSNDDYASLYNLEQKLSGY